MAKWAYTLDLVALWEQASNREIYASEFAERLAFKLKAMEFKKEHADLAYGRDEIVEELEIYVEEFKDGDGDGEASDYDDIDEFLSMLYDWGDTVVDSSGGFFNRVKACWVKK